MGGVYEGPCLTAPNKSKADSVIFVGFTAIWQANNFAAILQALKVALYCP